MDNDMETQVQETGQPATAPTQTPSGEATKQESSIPEPTGTSPILDEARKLARQIEQANEETKKLISRQEQLMAEATLGGRSQIAQFKEPEMSPEEYANAFMEGKIKPTS